MPGREIRIGVTQLVAMLVRPGDLVSGFAPMLRGQEGTEGHQFVAARRPETYRTEVPVEFAYEWEGYRLIVRGRIDGLTVTEDTVEVEEIKTTYAPLESLAPGHNPLHEAQLTLYIYFLMERYPSKEVTGKLTYLNLGDLTERSFPLEVDAGEAEALFTRLAVAFLSAERDADRWRETRDASLVALEFPFPERRPGQDELMETVAEALAEERDLFVEAATGIGKTIAVLYPSLKRLAGSDRYKRIFFLTAKTAGKRILRSTLEAAHARGLRLRTVFIEAKGRVCPNPGSECHPDVCPCARDYYAKAARILPGLLEEELVTPERVRERAAEEEACPFELGLDLSLFADLIVCDYNYVFDPRVHLRRFFGPGMPRDHLFLVDEAHNLVSRGREMYSADLLEAEVVSLRADVAGADDELARACDGVAEFFRAWGQEMRDAGAAALRLGRLPEMLEPALERLLALAERFLGRQAPGPVWNHVLDFYFQGLAFTRIAALLSEEYAIYVKGGVRPPQTPPTVGGAGGAEPGRIPPTVGGAVLRLLCLNPGPLLRKRLDCGRTAVFFSATLSPFDYFRELAGGRQDARHLQLPSPFPAENRLHLFVPGIDTRYRARETSAPALARCAADMVTARAGNYLMFFPSYAYLSAVRPLVEQLLEGRAEVLVQTPSMSDAEKERFLRRVSATGRRGSHLGLAVLGGLFGEGIDLPGEQLIGVLIVGPGLPVVDEEQGLIQEYFEKRRGEGFLFAYLVPGLIRVVQSAGRVFRTPEDKGVVLLVDNRFADERYRELLPPDWHLVDAGPGEESCREILANFWGGDLNQRA